MAPNVDYEACLVELNGRAYELVRGRTGQYAVIDIARRRSIGTYVVDDDGVVSWSNEAVELVLLAWVGHCLRHDLDPWCPA
jgi:hypothetical protein